MRSLLPCMLVRNINHPSLAKKMWAEDMCLLLLLTLQFISTSCSLEEKCVNTSIDITSCPNWQCNLTSLDLIGNGSNLESNLRISIHLCAEESDLQKVVLFQDISEVYIYGNDRGSIISCWGEATGIHFARVHTIRLENLSFSGCGGSSVSSSPSFLGSIRIANSMRVSVRNVTITNSRAAAMHVETENSESLYEFRDCKFRRNKIHQNETRSSCIISDAPETHTSGGGGGGIAVYFRNKSSDSTVLISDCVFERNSAPWGGAVYIAITNGTSSGNNSVVITRSIFSDNRAGERGGAIAAVYISPNGNTLTVTQCDLMRNHACIGGAMHIMKSLTYSEARMELSESNCANNTANLGAAIDLRPPYADVDKHAYMFIDNSGFVFTIRDSNFTGNNAVKDRKHDVESFYDTQIRGEGTLRIASFTLQIQGYLNMAGNTGSALYLESSIAEFLQGSESVFDGNDGYAGGAIAMKSVHSVVQVNDDTSISFLGNRAANYGGALYKESEKECFLSYSGTKENTGERNISLTFRNNTATSFGNSIFVNSLWFCTDDHDKCYEEILNSIATFDFSLGEEEEDKKDEVSTLGKTLVMPNIPKIVPGSETNIQVYMLDETHKITSAVFLISIVGENASSLKLAPGYTYMSNNKLKLLGKPKRTAEITISPIHWRNIELILNVTLSDCPPGYYYKEESMMCECSSYTDRHYLGISSCKSMRAQLHHNYWAGYIAANETDEKAFRTAYCPRGFCVQKRSQIKFNSLSANKDLSEIVCRSMHYGILCSGCRENHSMFYHSQNSCKRNRLCHIGWLLYILSDILPVTILFFVVIIFNINLTSGRVNGFLFYVQVFDTLSVDGNNSIWFQPRVYKLLHGFRFIVRMFKINFFSLPILSFCLWEGASALDIITFHYITILYALLLVIVTVKVINPYILNKLLKRCKVKKYQLSDSIIHGLSGFLVMCYSQCTEISLSLLTHTYLYGQGGAKKETRVLYDGKLEYLKGKHLFYAIPAVFIFIVIAILPAVLLSYPLCYRVLALFKLEESKFTKILCKVIPLESYKPFFDSFQGDFKDKHRYFAGLYFTYRLCILITAAFVNTSNLYPILQFQLATMLGIHAYIQPYKEKWPNRVDTLIFTLLVIINGCTFYNYHRIDDPVKSKDYTPTLTTIQVLIAYLPLLFMSLYVSACVVSKLKKRIKRKKDPINVLTESMLSPYYRQLDESGEISSQEL